MAHSKEIPTIEEVAAILKLWEDSNASEAEGVGARGMKMFGRPYADVLSQLADFYALQPSANDACKPQFEGVDGRRHAPSRKLIDTQSELGSSEKKKLVNFEQETWDLYQLEGRLDHTRLLEECQRRAHMGDIHAAQRLKLLHDFHRLRHSYDTRWEIPLHERDPPEVAPNPQVQATWGPHIWALLIGNNNYPHSPLQGAVNDSLAWKSYLIDFLGVPPSHIVHFQDADRKTMVTALYDLRDNDKILEGDHVIFVYAGHGSSYDAKDYSFEDDISLRAGSIEALCPVDRGLPCGRGTPDICDREVLLILSEIHSQTKAKITVFLDCCHSGGGVRELRDEQRSRDLSPLVDPEVIKRMFVAADEHPRRRPSTMSVRSPSWTMDTVNIYQPTLFAACQDTERAHEVRGIDSSNGMFTSAVLQVLRSEKGRNLTCSGLIEIIGPLRHDQKPRFDGEDAALFEVRTLRVDPPFNATTSPATTTTTTTSSTLQPGSVFALCPPSPG